MEGALGEPEDQRLLPAPLLIGIEILGNYLSPHGFLICMSDLTKGLRETRSVLEAFVNRWHVVLA